MKNISPKMLFASEKKNNIISTQIQIANEMNMRIMAQKSQKKKINAKSSLSLRVYVVWILFMVISVEKH